MHVHITPVGINPVTVEKVLNRIGGIDKLYLLYTVPKDGDYVPKKKKSRNNDGSTNNTNSSMPSDISGTANYVEKDGGNAADIKGEMTSKELAEEIRSSKKSGIPVIELIETDMFDFDKNVDIITKIYEKEKGDGVSFSVNITAGTKVMACAACYSSYYTKAVLYYARETDESIEDSIHLITPKRPKDLSKYKKRTKEILRYINDNCYNKNDYVTNKEITEELLVDGKVLKKQTVAYNIKLLKSEGLIEEDMEHSDGRTKGLRITDMGRWTMSDL